MNPTYILTGLIAMIVFAVTVLLVLMGWLPGGVIGVMIIAGGIINVFFPKWLYRFAFGKEVDPPWFILALSFLSGSGLIVFGLAILIGRIEFPSGTLFTH